jgi:4-alpha-glucanotransferase
MANLDPPLAIARGLLDYALESPSKNHWERIGRRPHHGVNVPLFALRSHNSCGVGEFLDLKLLIDWCCTVGMEVIQLLPLNDIGKDPSPYNEISSCALNPLFLSLHALPALNAELRERLRSLQALTEDTRIPYGDLFSQKMAWLRLYCEEHGQEIIKTQPFQEFVEKNGWLEPYILFHENVEFLKDGHFYSITQYLCYCQMIEVKEYASAHAILLKGDIPILVSPFSADVWYYKELFDTHFSAGAPPDAYNREGQYWGFPIFNWEALKRQKYRWWKERLRYASHFYDLYRIDHVVGFFRIWAILRNHSGREGMFIPRDPRLWIPQGREILKMMLASSPLLPIAEDLGEVPQEVRTCLKELGICGTKVMRWERLWNQGEGFIPINAYPELSMTTVSTHDSETLALWWRDSPREAKAYADLKKWVYDPILTKEQRSSILWDSHHTSSLFHINLLQEYLALFPELVWPKIEDERINIPGRTLPTNWTYRFRPFLEDLQNHDALKSAIKSLLK